MLILTWEIPGRQHGGQDGTLHRKTGKVNVKCLATFEHTGQYSEIELT